MTQMTLKMYPHTYQCFTSSWASQAPQTSVMYICITVYEDKRLMKWIWFDDIVICYIERVIIRYSVLCTSTREPFVKFLAGKNN